VAQAYRGDMAEIIPFPAPAAVPDIRPATARPVPRATPARPGLQPLWREAVGDVLRTARHERGDRLTDTARRSGVSPQYLSEMERGLKDPSSEMIAAVAGALDLTLVDLTRAVTERLAPAPGTAVLRAA
jgi:hypothetical protein